MKHKEVKIHPTQKPVALYKWLLTKLAEPGDKILDTHLGSGSSRIAAHDLGFEFVGCEIDEVYFRMEEERFESHAAQQRMEL
ncbi:MAG: site-specific DNA-methyltransferase [Oscillospiraceae bacterium]|nr:site-specific DNA-methyltransferase [Oscillospiraceae bacterium]